MVGGVQGARGITLSKSNITAPTRLSLREGTFGMEGNALECVFVLTGAAHLKAVVHALGVKDTVADLLQD